MAPLEAKEAADRILHEERPRAATGEPVCRRKGTTAPSASHSPSLVQPAEAGSVGTVPGHASPACPALGASARAGQTF